MKTIKLPIFYFLTILSLGVFTIFNGCKNPAEGIKITTTSGFLKNQMLIQFVNAKESSSKQPATFELTISGKNANGIYTSGGKKQLMVYNGVITLAMLESVQPSESNPIEFNIYAKPEGFSPVSKTFVITRNEPSEHIITLVDYSDPSEGTASLVSTINLNTNGTIPETKIVIPTTPETPLKSEIKVKEGTSFISVDGDTLKGDNLKSEIVYHSTLTEGSLNTFPGGFNPANIQGPTGPLEGGGTFTTAGFFSINMKVGDKEVKSFTEPLEIKAEVADNISNPETGNPIKEGDSIPTWSLNEETGEWNFEGNAVLAKNANGKLEAQFEAAHLSAWNIDFYTGTCNNSLTVNFRLTGSTTPTQYWVRLVSATGGYLSGLYSNTSWSSPVTISNNMVEVIPRVPNQQARIVVLKNRSGSATDPNNIIAQTSLFNPCSQGSIIVTIPQAPPTSPILNVDVNTLVYCQKRKNNVLYTGYFSVREKTAAASTAQNYYMVNGALSIANLKEGVTYVISTVYEGKTYNTEFAVTKNSTTLPNISGLTGTATYVPATNKLKIDVRFSTPEC